ncbi:low-specificity L-threonine aldolase [Desulfogranum japonicum]|uniref:low-specificity L-threonine aldolase n=1 Tax=Desulfogranum japonicum TaxID=231447 RepID=UPI00048CD594
MYIDLRSDTVTPPTDAMRRVMADAVVGDDVYGEDPTIRELEEYCADLLGKEAALFTTSGTQGNLLGIMVHCQRGDEYIVGQQAHAYRYEAGGAAILASVQPQPLNFESDGTLDLKKVTAAIKPDDVHFARTRLLCLENTHNGMALPLGYVQEAAKVAAMNQLKLHLDGARLFNAAVFLDVPVKQLVQGVDTVSVCLSKGLGAPVGSLLCGSYQAIHEARKWRKMLGGGLRQAGILAAAGLYALQQHVSRLQEDHTHAALLAQGLTGIPGIEVQFGKLQTNMVFIKTSEQHARGLSQYLKEHNILIGTGNPIRLVTHLGISGKDIEQVIACCRAFFKN